MSKVPIDEYTLARSAIEAAKEAEAARYAPGLWFQAEQAYILGERRFEDRLFDESERAFKKSRELAERAENSARFQKVKNGEVDP